MGQVFAEVWVAFAFMAVAPSPWTLSDGIAHHDIGDVFKDLTTFSKQNPPDVLDCLQQQENRNPRPRKI